MKIDIGMVKEDRNFSEIDDEKASVFNIYNKAVA